MTFVCPISDSVSPEKIPLSLQRARTIGVGGIGHVRTTTTWLARPLFHPPEEGRALN
jgi:hypothetical protein